jgi:hypothetical protein
MHDGNGNMQQSLFGLSYLKEKVGNDELLTDTRKIP